MALAFDWEGNAEVCGAPLWPRDIALWPGRSARERPTRLARIAAPDLSPETSRRESAAIAAAFVGVAGQLGLGAAERALLLGANPDPSRLILALETLGAALDLCGAPEAAGDWLRAPSPQAPFKGRTPLSLFAADGRYGVEMALLHLRARLRRAQA